MDVLTVVPQRILSNGLVVFLRELHIKEVGTSLSWFEYGMLHRKEGVDPCKYIPRFLNERLEQAMELEDETAAVETLLKIGDWMAGWAWAQMNSEDS